MQRRRSLLPTGGKRVKTCTPARYGSPAELLGGIRPLPLDGARVIPRLAISHELDAGNGDCAYQEDMHEAPLVQEKLQNEPNQKK